MAAWADANPSPCPSCNARAVDNVAVTLQPHQARHAQLARAARNVVQPVDHAALVAELECEIGERGVSRRQTMAAPISSPPHRGQILHAEYVGILEAQSAGPLDKVLNVLPCLWSTHTNRSVGPINYSINPSHPRSPLRCRCGQTAQTGSRTGGAS